VRLARSNARRQSAAYPFCLPFLGKGFEHDFSKAITVIVGESGSGKSTLLEGVAAFAGYDEAGSGKGPVDYSSAIEVMGGSLAGALRASWLPRSRTAGFFAPKVFPGSVLPR
jgi:predicted ATPase